MNKKGFTLIEMLIVVVVLGILIGVSVSVIGPSQQKERAEDSVRLRNIKAIAEGMESYNQIERAYPPDTSIDDPNSLLYQVYLDEWPGDEYKYTNLSGDFVLEVENSLGGCYKYQSTWFQVMSCPSGQCTPPSDETPSSSSASDCSEL